jgi:hypothetical protein
MITIGEGGVCGLATGMLEKYASPMEAQGRGRRQMYIELTSKSHALGGNEYIAFASPIS